MDNRDNLEELKDKLTIEEVLYFLNMHGGNAFHKGDVIQSQTICHNPPGQGSQKLFYYDNTKLFRCYTECAGEAFDIFQLVIKIKKQENIEYTLPQALYYVANFFGITLQNNQNVFEEQYLVDDFKKMSEQEQRNKPKEKKRVELNFYDKKVLKYMPTPVIQPWIKEGIAKEVMDRCGICYNPVSQGILIPHYDKDNNLIGIRERTLIKENEVYGKYRPSFLNGKMYNHPLGFSLYNLNNSKNAIKTIGKAIVYEGEKSALLYQSYFGQERDISVAVCGSSITSYQVDLLVAAGAKEIVIAFDKQYQKLGDSEYRNWIEKLKSIGEKYSNLVTITFLLDTKSLLGYKDSPIDRGKDIFLKLYDERKRIK